jgi:hypothetical protein
MDSTSQHTAVQNAVTICCTADDAPITNVIVFADRAQVTRQVKLHQSAAFEQMELQLDGISHQCESESIRVEVERGLAVLDVSYRTIRTKKQPTELVDSTQEETRALQLKSIMDQRKVLEREKELLQVDDLLIQDFGNTLTTDEARRSVMNNGSLEYFDTYWQYQRKERRNIAARLLEIDQEMVKADKEYGRLIQQGVKPAEEELVTTRITVLFEPVETTEGKQTEYVAYISYGTQPMTL